MRGFAKFRFGMTVSDSKKLRSKQLGGRASYGMLLMSDDGGGEQQKPDPSSANSSAKDANDPIGTNASQSDRDAGNSSGVPLRDNFRSDAGGSCYGFPELTDLKDFGLSNADSDLRNKKELAEGAFKLLAGEEPNAAGIYHLVTGNSSATERAIGLAVGIGAFVFAPEAVAAGEAAEAVLGTDALAGIGTFVQQVKNAAAYGSIAKEAAELYGNINTRVEGLIQFDNGARNLSKGTADDHTPGEARAKQMVQP
jgi:hypothetical protein